GGGEAGEGGAGGEAGEGGAGGEAGEGGAGGEAGEGGAGGEAGEGGAGGEAGEGGAGGEPGEGGAGGETGEGGAGGEAGEGGAGGEAGEGGAGGEPGEGGAGGETGEGGAGGEGGEGGAGAEPACVTDEDCADLVADACMTWVCNDGTYEGPVGACVEVPAEAGTPCDDGLFCTLGDACDGAGVCVGTLPNDCGLSGSECEEVVCDETQDACVLVAANEGGACDSGDLCAPGTCVAGVCEPTPIDCSGLDDQCGTGECNPST